ncbi:MAG TPA: glycosyltransferase N-terminal domain-containing protein [Daejeonella sp.]|jgi:3-deoxy-D-manno-octulosonic-acid transferase|uniref:3-deoxy-D-manno-octulosonic acid transferase n=1 Tax=Daejeonella sp. TaxID=2805397 RepID=UPI002ED97A00
MLFLYDTGIYLYTLFIRIASIKNKKAAAWINGRKGLIPFIESSLHKNKNYTWFHFASLGEFEQGRPVLERLKSENPEMHVVITFFSPSGYEIRKNYALADHVFYLPTDTSANAKEFIRILNPVMAIFTKYEYWYHYFDELHKNNIPLYVISGIFRKEQVFFKWYGGLHRKMLSKVSHFFVQNQNSSNLLNDIGFKNVTVNGDTRFDRVEYNATHTAEIKIIRDFTKDNKIFIAGSTWPDDEKLISKLAYSFPDWKFIIAPHEVKPERTNEITELFPNSIRYSEINSMLSETIDNQNISSTFQVLIIDNIGLLSSAYQYGDIAYIGGGFGVGIHNTLEAAAFGLPVIFGPNYQRFNEAVELITAGAAFTIKDQEELRKCMENLQTDIKREACGKAALNYVKTHTGATRAILNFIGKFK